MHICTLVLYRVTDTYPFIQECLWSHEEKYIYIYIYIFFFIQKRWPGKRKELYEYIRDATTRGGWNDELSGTFEALAIPSPMVTQSQKECQ